jgi:hypothetical protein
VTLLFALLLAAPVATVFDGFDAPLDTRRWYVGVARPPKDGALRIPRDGWIAARGTPDATVELLEISYCGRGGQLEVTFHAEEEPLSRPVGEPLRVPRGRDRAPRLLRIGGGAASLDGEPLPWGGKLSGTFRLRARKGEIELQEVRVAPAPPPLAEPGYLERRTVLLATTPRVYRDETGPYHRVTLTLWDVEACFLLRRRRGASSFGLLSAAPKGAPVLAALVDLGDGKQLAAKASGHALAARDWGDEKRNLPPEEFQAYLSEQYALFDLLSNAQRALNAAVPGRKDLEPLVHLVVIRHADNARAAVALAETRGGKRALKALREALEGDRDLRRVTGDRLRRAAGQAARALLGEEVPEEWPGFRFDPQNRYVTMDRARELSR